MFVPIGTAHEIITRLNAEWVKLAEMPDTQEKMRTAGFEPMSSTPEQAAEFVKTEIVRWAKVVKDSGAKVD